MRGPHIVVTLARDQANTKVAACRAVQVFKLRQSLAEAPGEKTLFDVPTVPHSKGPACQPDSFPPAHLFDGEEENGLAMRSSGNILSACARP
jgi:hypothetical protein